MTLNRMKLFLLALSLCLAAASYSGGEAQAGSGSAAGSVKLDQPLALASDPIPGLAVVYTTIAKKVRHVDSMRPDKQMLKHGEKGKPLLVLDHAFGSGNVFDSGRAWFVGVLINGMIKLDQPGVYGFQAMANDGVQISVGGHLVSEDGEWHSGGDRLSPPGEVQVEQAGWYPIKIKYFQRKGTATLRMYWKRPGQNEFSIIPAEAYGHKE